MAKSKKPAQVETTPIDNINDSLTSITEKVQKNQKIIVIASIAVVAIVAVVASIFFYFLPARAEKAATAIGDPDRELIVNGNDSLAMVQYAQVADNYGGDAGNRAALMAAIEYYKNGDYEKALKYVSDYDASDDVIGAAAYSLQGDCYVNLDKLSDAVSSFKKAISQSDDNPAYTPFFMMKLARVYQAQKNYSEEAEIYQEIKDKYPTYAANNGISIDKYIETAKARSAK